MPHPLALLPRLPRYFTQAELQRFFAAISDPRDLALFTLIYHHALRVGEVALLRRGDVDLGRNHIVVWRLKGGAWSAQPLLATTAALLTTHLASSPGDSDGPLFAGRNGPLRKRQIQTLFTRYRATAGVPARLTCHSLRHAIATHLLDADVPLEVVQDRLGHQSIRSTSIYARITDHHRAAVFRRLERSPWIVQPGGGVGPDPAMPQSDNAPLIAPA